MDLTIRYKMMAQTQKTLGPDSDAELYSPPHKLSNIFMLVDPFPKLSYNSEDLGSRQRCGTARPHKLNIAEILGHKDTKVISDEHLSDLVRQIAVNCNLASLVLQRQQSNPEDPFASNPLERLRQIKRIKQKALLELGLQNPTEQDHRGQKLDDFTDFV
ncbi:tuberous sclerosis 2 [Mytilus galloprovincialis]|uniref:Tuberous sclerosis 2 n=1 Tax=Mytilus galloprovincialis TaxID=29158 RepID=A0A8B6GRN6_MYTGA|nr:tuberous sclerosis 2 [Mytilus galloprovincialis]